MQAMKLEKDNAIDRAEIAEQKARDANLRAEKVWNTETSNWKFIIIKKNIVLFNFPFCNLVRRRSTCITEKNPTNREWIGSGSRTIIGCQYKIGRKGKSPANCKLNIQMGKTYKCQLQSINR